MKFYGIPIVNDIDKEPVETFTASLSTTDSDVNIVNGTVTITIIDDDGRLFFIITFRLYILCDQCICIYMYMYINQKLLNFENGI